MKAIRLNEEASSDLEQIPDIVFLRELEAVHHWVFGTDQPEFQSLTGSGRYLVSQELTPVLSAGFATTPGDASLDTRFWKANEFTMCGVSRYDSDPETNNGMFCGNYGNSVGLSVYGRGGDPGGLQFINTGTNINLNTPATFNGFCFWAVAVSATDILAYCPQCSPASFTLTEVFSLKENSMIVGNGAYQDPDFGSATGADIAELIFFDRALSLSELAGVRQRSDARVARPESSITIEPDA